MSPVKIPVKPMTECGTCGDRYTVNVNGRIRKHNWGDEPCQGSGEPSNPTARPSGWAPSRVNR